MRDHFHEARKFSKAMIEAGAKTIEKFGGSADPESLAERVWIEMLRAAPETSIMPSPAMLEAGIEEAREHRLGDPLDETIKKIYFAMRLEQIAELQQ